MKAYEELDFKIPMKNTSKGSESPFDKHFSQNMKTGEMEVFTPRDGNTINLLINQIDASQFHWRKKDLAMIQNFTFKCYLSLTEALYRASILIELFMSKINDFEADMELEEFFERFLNKMVEYRKGFTMKRRNSSDNNNILENSENTLNSPLPGEKSNLFDYQHNNILPTDVQLIDRKKNQRFLLPIQEQHQTLNAVPTLSNISVNISQNKGNNINNANNNIKEGYNPQNTINHIELLNEFELYVPLGISELIEIFFMVFPDKDYLDIAEEWARSIKKDKTTSHFQSKENLVKYLNLIKNINENDEPKTQALKTLENLIILKEEALEIQMEKIKEMMELYGEFVALFSRRFYEKNHGNEKKHRRFMSKENTSEFVKKALKDKCVNFINRKLENDQNDEICLDNNKEKTSENTFRNNDLKDSKLNEKRDLDEIKRNINDLCMSYKSKREITTGSSYQMKRNSEKNSFYSNYYQNNNASNLSEISSKNKGILKKSATLKMDAIDDKNVNQDVKLYEFT